MVQDTYFSIHQTGNSDCRATQSPESPPCKARELGAVYVKGWERKIPVQVEWYGKYSARTSLN